MSFHIATKYYEEKLVELRSGSQSEGHNATSGDQEGLAKS